MANNLRVGLKAYWKFNEVSGNRADSINSYTLTDNNTVGSTANGKIGRAAVFVPANSEYLSYATAAEDDFDIEFGDPSFTFGGWVRLGATSSQSIFNKEGAALADRSPQIGVANNGGSQQFAVAVRKADDSGFHLLFASTHGTPATNVFIFLVAWLNSGTDTLNIQINDGTVDSLDLAGGGVKSTPTAPINFGRIATANFATGLMDEMFWVRRVYNSAERSLIYNGGSGLPLSGWGAGGGARTYYYDRKRRKRRRAS